MDPISAKTFELEIQIEELEPRTAPDGGETVWSLTPTQTTQ